MSDELKELGALLEAKRTDCVLDWAVEYGELNVNVTLNSLAELGLLGTVPLIALALIAAWSIIRRALDAPSPLAMVLVFCLFSVGTYSQFTAQFYFPAAQLVLILFAGLAIDWFSRDAPERDPGTVATSRFGIPLACIVVLMSVATLGISYTDLVVRRHALYQVRYFNYPRFWLNGSGISTGLYSTQVVQPPCLKP